jgi:hypothetical protein
MRLILHAGTHKTGTTSIQKVLADNRDALRTQGVFYPTGRVPFGESAVPHHEFAHAMTGADPEGRRLAAAFVSSALSDARKDDQVIISAEPIYRHVSGRNDYRCFTLSNYWELRKRYLDAVARQLRDFDVNVLLFFRHADTFAEALYLALAEKSYWRGAFEHFLTEFAPWFQYERQIQLFRSAFGKLEVQSYEASLPEGGAVAAFFSAIGVPMPEGAKDVWVRRSPKLDLFPSPEARAEFRTRFPDAEPRRLGWT